MVMQAPEIHTLCLYRSTGRIRTVAAMAFEVVLDGDGVEWVDGADSYEQEGPMTTFFDNGERAGGLGCWSLKVASYRTSRIVRIRRAD
jgi:hypothetical protein